MHRDRCSAARRCMHAPCARFPVPVCNSGPHAAIELCVGGFLQLQAYDRGGYSDPGSLFGPRGHCARGAKRGPCVGRIRPAGTRPHLRRPLLHRPCLHRPRLRRPRLRRPCLRRSTVSSTTGICKHRQWSRCGRYRPAAFVSLVVKWRRACAPPFAAQCIRSPDAVVIRAPHCEEYRGEGGDRAEDGRGGEGGYQGV